MEEKNKTKGIDYILLVLVAVSAVLIIIGVWSDVQNELTTEIHEVHNPEYPTLEGPVDIPDGGSGSGYGKVYNTATPGPSPTPEPTWTQMPFGEDE